MKRKGMEKISAIKKSVDKAASKRQGEVTEVTPGPAGGVTISEGDKTHFFGNDGPYAVSPELRQVGAKCSFETKDGVDYATPMQQSPRRSR